MVDKTLSIVSALSSFVFSGNFLNQPCIKLYKINPNESYSRVNEFLDFVGLNSYKEYATY